MFRYSEIKNWDFEKAAKKEDAKGMTGHFTQMIWVDTQKVKGFYVGP